MSGFVVKDPNTDGDPVAPGVQTPADIVAGDGWWPDVNLRDLRDAVRLDTSVPTVRIRDAARNAMLEMARELRVWRADQEAQGRTALKHVPGRILIDGQSDYLILWARGVYSIVAGDLAGRLRGMSATAAGHDRADELATEGDVHARNVAWAVRDFLDAPRVRARTL